MTLDKTIQYQLLTITAAWYDINSCTYQKTEQNVKKKEKKIIQWRVSVDSEI